MRKRILITGANRGLGAEFVRQYAKEDTIIFACCRQLEEATELRALQKQYPHIHIHQLDVTSAVQRSALAKGITDPIDILINNAGTIGEISSLGELSVDEINQTFLVNAVAPLKVTEAFIPHLSKGKDKLVVAITSKMGSLADNSSGGYYGYRSSKAALNMFMKSAGIDLTPQGIKVLLLHPGWVKTRMGGENALLEVEQSIAGMRKVIAAYTPTLGEVGFYGYDGKLIPW